MGGLTTKKRVRHTRVGGAAVGNLIANWTYDNEGKLVTMDYPDANQLANPTQPEPGGLFTYTYDSRDRLNGLTETRDRVVPYVKTVTYNDLNQLTGLSYLNQIGATAAADTYYTETRQYNTLGQLTRLTTPGVADLEFRFHATQNDGLLQSRKDHVTGEDVTYQYDALQRLASSQTTHTTGTAPQWGLSFAYDGFGNKTGQSVTLGSAPSYTVPVNTATNRLIVAGISYDANGNQTSLPNGGSSVTLDYDVANRLVATGHGEQYSYDAANKRIWRKKAGATPEEVYFYGLNGERLGTYRFQTSGSVVTFLEVHKNVYFAGQLIRGEGAATSQNPVGSDLSAGKRYYPYGEQLAGPTANDDTKFGTYHRDSTTGLDYADQRYYSSQYGRFMTPDPGLAGADPTRPQSWNRYAYAEGDPINKNDPSGLLPQASPYDVPAFVPIYTEQGWSVWNGVSWEPWVGPLAGGLGAVRGPDAEGGVTLTLLGRVQNAFLGAGGVFSSFENANAQGTLFNVYLSGNTLASIGVPGPAVIQLALWEVELFAATKSLATASRQSLIDRCVQERTKQINRDRQVFIDGAGKRIAEDIAWSAATGGAAGLLEGPLGALLGLVAGAGGEAIASPLKEWWRQRQYNEETYLPALKNAPGDCAKIIDALSR